MNKNPIISTVTHNRKGRVVNIDNIIGNIKIVSHRSTNRKRKSADLVTIDVTGTTIAHDSIKIKGTKGRVQIKSQEMLTPPHCDLTIYVPSNATVRLDNVGGSITISESLEALVIKSERPCQVFTETLHGVVLDVGADANIKIKQLLGHCDVTAHEDSTVEIRDASVSTLSASLYSGARLDMHGVTRFAKINLNRHARCHVNAANFIDEHHDPSSILTFSLLDSHKIDEAERRAVMRQADAEIATFARGLLPIALGI